MIFSNSVSQRTFILDVVVGKIGTLTLLPGQIILFIQDISFWRKITMLYMNINAPKPKRNLFLFDTVHIHANDAFNILH